MLLQAAVDLAKRKIDAAAIIVNLRKFGFGRCVRDTCRMIQNGQMTRDDGLELVRKYDDEFPKSHHEEHLEYLDLSQAEFTETIDKHRDPQIWEQQGNQWVLRHPPE